MESAAAAGSDCGIFWLIGSFGSSYEVEGLHVLVLNDCASDGDAERQQGDLLYRSSRRGHPAGIAIPLIWHIHGEYQGSAETRLEDQEPGSEERQPLGG